MPTSEPLKNGMEKSAMEPKPLVSIIINNYNYAHFLLEAIDSTLNQSYFNTKMLVVEDISSNCLHDVIVW